MQIIYNQKEPSLLIFLDFSKLRVSINSKILSNEIFLLSLEHALLQFLIFSISFTVSRRISLSSPRDSANQSNVSGRQNLLYITLALLFGSCLNP